MNETAENETDLSLKAGDNGAISSSATHPNDASTYTNGMAPLARKGVPRHVRSVGEVSKISVVISRKFMGCLK